VSIGCTAPSVDMIGGPVDGARLEAPILSVFADGALLELSGGHYIVDARSRKAYWTPRLTEPAHDWPEWW
jgi:hypothetical protein